MLCIREWFSLECHNCLYSLSWLTRVKANDMQTALEYMLIAFQKNKFWDNWNRLIFLIQLLIIVSQLLGVDSVLVIWCIFVLCWLEQIGAPSSMMMMIMRIMMRMMTHSDLSELSTSTVIAALQWQPPHNTTTGSHSAQVQMEICMPLWRATEHQCKPASTCLHLVTSTPSLNWRVQSIFLTMAARRRTTKNWKRYWHYCF